MKKTVWLNVSIDVEVDGTEHDDDLFMDYANDVAAEAGFIVDDMGVVDVEEVMNREEKIEATIKAYMDSIMSNDIEAWVENILRYGRNDKGIENLTDEELDDEYALRVNDEEAK